MTQPPDWDQPTAGQPGLLPSRPGRPAVGHDFGEVGSPGASQSHYFGEVVASEAAFDHHFGEVVATAPSNGHAIPPAVGHGAAGPTGVPPASNGAAANQAPTVSHRPPASYTTAGSHTAGAGPTSAPPAGHAVAANQAAPSGPMPPTGYAVAGPTSLPGAGHAPGANYGQAATGPPNSAEVGAFAELVRRLANNVESVVLGKPQVVRLALTALLAEGHVLLEDVPGVGKTTLGTRGRGERAGAVAAHPVHARPAAVRRHRRDDLQSGDARVRVPSGAGVRQHRHRRRDQPRVAEDAVGTARGDGGAIRHRGRGPARGAAAVPRGGDPEPDRDGRHVPVARGAARPVPDEAHRRLSGRGRRDRGPEGCRGRPHAGVAGPGHRHRDGRCAGPARPPRPHRRPALRLRRPAGGGDPDTRSGTGRGVAARGHRTDPSSLGVRPDRRPPVRDPGGPEGARRAGLRPPAAADPRRPGPRGQPGRRAARGARHRAGSAGAPA